MLLRINDELFMDDSNILCVKWNSGGAPCGEVHFKPGLTLAHETIDRETFDRIAKQLKLKFEPPF